MGRIEIIVTRCTDKPHPKHSDRVFGPSLRSTEDMSEALAVSAASWFRKDGVCVVVRPTYNAPDGEMYEWRSFNGDTFQRVSFGYPLGRKVAAVCNACGDPASESYPDHASDGTTYECHRHSPPIIWIA